MNDGLTEGGWEAGGGGVATQGILPGLLRRPWDPQRDTEGGRGGAGLVCGSGGEGALAEH